MKENQDTTEDLWIMVTTALKAASDAAAWAFWRERFNTNHPDNIRQEEIVDPAQFAYANWVAAKHVYCSHRDELDKYLEYKMTSEPYPGATMQIEFFIAMKRTVEKEMQDEMEKTLTEENAMGRVKNLEIDLSGEEIDEDEQYVRETNPGTWDGDEYVIEDEEYPFDDLDDDDLDDDDFSEEDEE
jgi:hypothetical protein